MSWGEFSIRNVLLIAVCIEVACVLTGLLVFEWQQRVHAYQIEVERSLMHEQVNDLMIEILQLRKELQSSLLNDAEALGGEAD